MSSIKTIISAALVTGLCSASAIATEYDFSGYIELQHRQFFQQPGYQLDNQFSIAIEPEWQTSSDDGDHLLSFKPFYRWDDSDNQRTHGDIRELLYIYVANDWELHAGIGRVFWGVTESTHLVDIVNQTDAVETIDGEDKLGQPMIKLSLVKDWGIVDAFLLPGFRERTFQGENGRFSYPLPLDDDSASYQHSQGQDHVDLALRWSQTFNDLDIGLSWFKGTSREPSLIPQQTELENSATLVPFYPQIQQLGLEAQYIFGDWTLKSEIIHREGSLIENYWAMNSGFEYTFYGVAESAADVGVLMELLYDSRNAQATSPAQRDLFFGARIALNDADSSEVLAGISQDLQASDSRSMVIEASMRFGDSTKITLDAWLFKSSSPDNLLYNFRKEDFVTLSIQQYF